MFSALNKSMININSLHFLFAHVNDIHTSNLFAKSPTSVYFLYADSIPVAPALPLYPFLVVAFRGALFRTLIADKSPRYRYRFSPHPAGVIVFTQHLVNP